MKKEIRLKDFKPDEHVLIVVRRHWFVFFRQIIGLMLLFFIPFFAVPILSLFITSGGVDIPNGLGFFFASLWALILWQMLFARWTDYYYDVWIVTNWRIIDIDQNGFYSRNIATLLNFEHIEDITTHVKSVIGTFLNFGSVQIQTAAAKREFIFESVSNPRNVEAVIRKAQERYLGLHKK